jgi:pyruvate dehydrogenase E2 component (dihydrolipoamide acetyltransferase)
MPLEFKLPDIGEGIAEGEIVKWLVKVGDTVKEHQSIVEVMTDKATVEVPAPAAGKITALNAKEGDTVPVGSVLFVIETGASSAPRTQPSTQPQAQPAKPSPAQARTQAATQSPTQPQAQAAKQSPAQPTARPTSSSPTPPSPVSTAASASGSTIEFKLPDIGEGIAEGEIVKWLVKVGDAVKEHQSIVEVMTDKATVEVPAPAAGTITAIRAKEGEVVPVGKVIFSLATAGTGSVAAPSRATQPQQATKTQAAPTQTAARAPASAAAPSAASAQAPARAPAARELVGAGTGAGANAPAARAPALTSVSDGKILAVPSARRLARDMNVDLAQVTGSGRNGVVRRADVEAFANGSSQATTARDTAPSRVPGGVGASGGDAATRTDAGVARAPATPTHFAPGEREKRIPFRGVRRKIAEAMVRSKFTAPHFTVIEEVDVTDLVSLREQAKAIGAESNVKVTFMPFIMKATAIALAKHPMLNAHLDESTQELVQFQYVNLGIAMDTENGLIVPVVRDVQAKGILQLASELAELAERTRAGKVKSEELKGSTFSITNAGNIGGTLATPIINFPDVAILGVHRIMKKPGVVETPEGDKIAVRQYMNFSCSVDHRLADGADGARFLVYLKKLLENPGLLAL